jgi:DNA polymerase-3 subunit epsilon
MREIVLDTETTGLDPNKGHRVVEIGCVEVVNYVATGKKFHAYLNPERFMPEDARHIHGLSDEFLADKPVFSSIASEFVNFIADSNLIIHNAGFDMKFVNFELGRAGYQIIPAERAIDTVALARRTLPGSPVSLDALCRRYGIDNGSRDYHGALLDAQLLAEVYLELRGGRQPDLVMAPVPEATTTNPNGVTRMYRAPRTYKPTADELAAHTAFIGTIKNALWLQEKVEKTA